MEYIASNVKKKVNVPVVFFTKGGANFFDELKDKSCDGVGVDWSVTIKQARHRVGVGKVLQGNFDPAFYMVQLIVLERLLKTYGVYSVR